MGTVRPMVNDSIVRIAVIRMEVTTTKVRSRTNRISTARNRTINGVASNNNSSNNMVRDRSRIRSGDREKMIRVPLNSTIKKIAEMLTVGSKDLGTTKIGATNLG